MYLTYLTLAMSNSMSTATETTTTENTGKKPTVIITIGMAGSGKTTFMQVRTRRENVQFLTLARD